MGYSKAHLLLLGYLVCILTQTAQSRANDDTCKIEMIDALRSALANNTLCNCGTTPRETNQEVAKIKDDVEKIKQDVLIIKDMLTSALNEHKKSSPPSYVVEKPPQPPLASGNAAESPGSRKTSNKTYYFDDSSEITWLAAVTVCVQRNMKLATAKTQEELDYLFNHNSVQKHQTVTNWWLSASDIGRSRGDFHWLDGTRLPKNSSLWRFKEDSRNHEFNSCVHLATNFIHDGNKLFHKRCDGEDQSFVICED